MRRRGGGVFEATVFAVVGVAILSGLGIWQLDRKVWKENLIALLTARLARAPEHLPPREAWPRLVPDGAEYSRVTFPAEFIAGEQALVYTAGSALRPDVEGAGYWVFAPARLAGGSIVVVNRGFEPLDRKNAAAPAPQGTIDLVGVLRWPEKPGLFTPKDEPQNNVWYTRDEFRYLWKKMAGDVSLAADIAYPDPKGYGDRKAVLVIRQELEDDSIQALVALHGEGMIHLAQRPRKGARVHDLEFRVGGRGERGAPNPDTLVTVNARRIGIEKRGDSFALFVSLEGEPMHQFGPPLELKLKEPFYVGIGFCSHLPDTADTAVLSNVVLENSAGQVK